MVSRTLPLTHSSLSAFIETSNLESGCPDGRLFSHCVYQTHPNKSPLATFAINRFWLTGSLCFREYWKGFAYEVEVWS